MIIWLRVSPAPSPDAKLPQDWGQTEGFWLQHEGATWGIPKKSKSVPKKVFWGLCIIFTLSNQESTIGELGLPWWLMVKNPPAGAGDVGSIPWWRTSPGGGNGKTLQYSFFFFSLQYSCLGNPMDRGAWTATVHACSLSCFSRVQRLGNLWTVAYQIPLSMGFFW